MVRNFSSSAPALPRLTKARSSRDPAFRLRRRGLLASHRLSLRSYLISTASAASMAKTMPKPKGRRHDSHLTDRSLIRIWLACLNSLKKKEQPYGNSSCRQESREEA